MTSPTTPLGAISSYVRMRHHRRNLLAVYEKYAAFTIIPPTVYLLNLQLAETVRRVDGAIVECGVWRAS